jgi:hypothetical protein
MSPNPSGHSLLRPKIGFLIAIRNAQMDLEASIVKTAVKDENGVYFVLTIMILYRQKFKSGVCSLGFGVGRC